MGDRKGSHLRLAHSVPVAEAERERMLHALSSRPYVSGPTWNDVLERRAYYLEYCYDCSDLAPKDIEARMERLKADVYDAVRARSYCSKTAFPLLFARECLYRIGVANVVEDTLPLSRQGAELTDRNRTEAFRDLSETLFRSAELRTTREGVENWLIDNRRARPNNPDLTWLAVAELNADRIGAALPLVLVVPNFHHPFNPFFIRLEEGIVVDPEIAEGMRLLFGR